MAKVLAGANAPDIALPATDGSTFKMTDYIGKRVILTFFRFSTCPFCNIRINRIIKRWNEFSEDTVMVGVFDAKIGELTKRMKKHNAPFTIVADESYEHFERNSVVKSFGRFLIGALRSPLTFMQATFKGYFPLTLSLGKLSIIPVDILIDEQGKVVKAHYCKDTADHLSIDELITFSKGN
jgi:peroxiredoxin